MSDQDVRILLEDRGNGEEGRVLADEGEGLEAARHGHVDTAGHQELADVEAGPALAHIALYAGFAIKTRGDRLVVAAMLGLGTPVGLDAHLIEGLGMRPAADWHQ